MFIFNNQPLSPDSAFTDPATCVQYPANWLRLASPEERAAIGITEAARRALSGTTSASTGAQSCPRTTTQLVEQWVQQTRTTANTLLAPTDWQVIREADNGKLMSAETKANRQFIREAAGSKITAINATTTTAELAAYITSNDYSNWNPVLEPIADDRVEFFSNGSHYSRVLNSLD
jgi:hypothetical protein